MKYADVVARQRAWLVSQRRWFHQHPELRFEERATAAHIAEEAEALGLAVRKGVAETGVVALLGEEGARPVLALRADMDALPVEEKCEHAYVSRNPGCMHACGHDAHMAMLLGAARLLATEPELRALVTGRVVFVFQPGEEGGAGGDRMVKAGVLDDPRVDAVFASHVAPEIPAGSVGIYPRRAFASARMIDFRIRGRGGHAAYPHQNRDPVVAAAHLITALQTISSRRVAPVDSAVVSICQMQAGPASNVIPDEVRLAGTVRYHDPQVGRRIEASLDEISDGVGRAFGVKITWEMPSGYPPTVNDEVASLFVRRAAEETLGLDRVLTIEPEMGGEDFAYFLQERPGAIWRLGVRSEAKGITRALHADRFDIDEDALVTGVRMWLAIVERFFASGLV